MLTLERVWCQAAGQRSDWVCDYRATLAAPRNEELHVETVAHFIHTGHGWQVGDS